MDSFTDVSGAYVNEKGLVKRRLSPPRLLISSALFGVIFTAFFAKQDLGLNLTIIFLLVYAYEFFNRRLIITKTFRQEKLLYLFTIPTIYLIITLFTFSSMINVLSVLVILAVMYVQYVVLSGSALNNWDEGGFFIDMIFAGINRVLFGSIRFVGDTVSTLFKGKKKAGTLIGVGAGVILLLIVVPLLVGADANVSDMFGQFIDSLALGDVFLYVFLFLLGASLVTAPAATALEPECTGQRKAFYITKRPIPAVTTGIALSMIAVVYVLFAGVQFRYFFAPQETIANVLGLTSSAYAVRGFGELIFITCLNFVLIMIAMRFTQQNDGKTPAFLKTLYTLLIAFNFVILASSHLRMQCYEISYGYSVARFLSHSFMLLLVILNAIMLARIFSNKVKLVRLFAAAALIYFCAVVAVNPESYVAKENIKRYEQTGKIDAEYLFSLSGDALGEACDFAVAYPSTFDTVVKQQAEYELKILERKTGWASLNLADERAKGKLQELLR